jgi:CheY-like chemotaxis protein
MEAATILVVEDEVIVAEEIKEDLERGGFRVPEIIASGEEVMEAVQRVKPDLIVMDVRIKSAVDGIDAAYLARAEFPVPVIYLTAYSDAETLRRAAGTNPSAFLSKPFREEELLACVRAALGA